jgi:predicted HicB family RNase H-like nuclease
MLCCINHILATKSIGKIFTGEVIGLRDMVTFQGRTPDQLEESFRASIDFYLDMCQQDGVSPEKSFSERFNIRLSPDIHRQIASRAAQQHVGINQWVSEAVRQALRQ